MSVAESIKIKLENAFNPAKVEVIDESHLHAGHVGSREGGETHFAVTVISDKFKSISRVARHKLVYEALKDELKGSVHALRIVAHAGSQN